MSNRPIVRGSVGEPAHVLLRLSVAATILLPLAVLYGEALVKSWLVAYEAIFEWVADDFRLLNLFIDHEGADRVIRARIMWKHIVVIGDKVIYPDPRGTANASTLLAHGLQGPLVAILAAVAWPVRKGWPADSLPWIEWVCRGAMLLPLLVVLVLVDIPMVLAGELWKLALDGLDPGSTSALVIWKSFMQGGGRYALGLAAGMLAVQAAWHAVQFACRLLGTPGLLPPAMSPFSVRADQPSRRFRS